MIHTFTIKHQINASEYGFFAAADHTQCYGSGRYTLKNSMLEDMGIILYARKYSVPGRSDYFCYEMFVNPCKVLGRNDVTQIYTADMFQDFQNQFNNIILDFDVPLPELQYWKAYRVDFTRNLEVENVDLYIKLFQKSDLSGYKFPKDDNNNVVRFRPGSLYCKKNNHTINFYNKYDELQHNNPYYGEEELQQARNILRIEVQCRKTKLDSIKQRFNLPDKKIVHFLQREDIAADTVKYYVKKLLGTAPYYKKPTAVRRIQTSNYKNITKTRMLQLLNDVSSQYSAVDRVKLQYQDFSALKKNFDRMGVNIVTINKNEPISVSLAPIYDLL